MKKTKIVATIGPATEQHEVMHKLVKAGMNVARLNFSHGSWEEHQLRFDNARKISKELSMPVAVLQDLSGPKIRIGVLKGEKIELKTGNKFTLTTKEGEGDEKGAWISYSKLPKEVSKGQTILLRDGRVKLQVLNVTADSIECEIVSGGEIKSKAGVNVPGAYLSISCLTDKDRKDIEFGLKNDVDYMALSFVRKGADVIELKNIIAKAGKDIKVMSKVETQEAIDNLDEIIKESDAIMVARGDLATEVPAEQVPILQKIMIKKCNAAGKPVLVATQMLESMISSSVPTRAEVNDIANAILDGADAVMLSEETTLGKHPEEAVKVMTRVALHTEKFYPHEHFLKKGHLSEKETTDSVSYAALNIAHETKAKAIVALSMSGFTARMLSRYRPKMPILVITPNEKTFNRMALKFNCYPQKSELFTGISDTIARSKEIIKKNGHVMPGDKIVIVGGAPFGKAGNTNMIFVESI